jgi:pyruvate dehydrogenase E2 component (dihydrolipoamide acetyltransferase)
LREFPLANGSFKVGRFELHPRVNLGIAVATDDSLVVPTVFDADRRSLTQIAEITHELARKVRDGTIAPAQLSGATFTVSNLGMHGIRRFTAIVNPPQAAILAVGAIEERPVIRGRTVEPGQVMSATLVCDHRILYGAYAARFLARIRELLEQPRTLAGKGATVSVG